MKPEELFERYVRDLLTDGDREELVRLLGTEAGARQFFDYIREWSLLADVSKRLAPAAPLSARDTASVPARATGLRPEVRTRRRWLASATVAAAAGLLIGLLLAVREATRSPDPAAPAAPAPSLADAGVVPGPPASPPDVEAVAAAKASLDRLDRNPDSTGVDPERLLSGTPEAPPLPPDPLVPFVVPPDPDLTDATPPPPVVPVPPAKSDPDADVSRYRAPSTTRLVDPSTTSVARLEGARGPVSILDPSGKRSPASSGQALLAGHGLRVDGGDARASVVYPDTSRLELAPDSTLKGLTDGRPLAPQDALTGKKAFFVSGMMTACVATQPPGRPLVITTPHAEARVQGTRFTLTVSEKATRLDVDQGRVRFTRRSDGAAVELTAGQYAATDAMGTALLRLRSRSRGPDVVRLIDDFEGPLRWYHAGGSAPIEYILSTELAHSPRLSLLFSFRPSKNNPDARAVFVHPVRIRPVERFIRFHARVATLEGRPEWSVSLRERDGDTWHVGNGAFEHLRAARGWNVFEVPIPDGSSDFVRHGDGNGRFDPSAVNALRFSVGGGRVVCFLDTVLAVEDAGREVPFPEKPSRSDRK